MAENVNPNRGKPGPSTPQKGGGPGGILSPRNTQEASGSGSKSGGLTSPMGLLWSTKPAPTEYEAPHPTHFFPAGKHEKLRKSFPPLIRDMLAITSNLPGRKDISFFRLGEIASTAYLAAAIMVPPKSLSIQKGKELCEKMKSCLQKHELSDIEVLVRFGVASSMVSGDGQIQRKQEGLLGGLLADTPLEQVSKIGCSIGLKNVGTSGTLGLYVTINGPHAGTYALTNCHIADPKGMGPDFPPTGPPPPALAAFNFKTTPSSPVREMEQPSRSDSNAFSAVLTTHIRNCEVAIQGKTAASTAESAEIRLAKNSMKMYKEKLAAIKVFSPYCGQVAFTSGRRFHSSGDRPYTLDWALIELDKNRYGTKPIANETRPLDVPDLIAIKFNSWPALLKPVGGKKVDAAQKAANDKKAADAQKALDTKIAAQWITPGLPFILKGTLDIVAELNRGEDNIRVLKRGRTTGFTTGIVNDFKTVWQWTKPDGTSFETTELGVLPFIGGEDIAQQGDDSGAVFFDGAKRVVGLLHEVAFKGNRVGRVWCAYATPINYVFDDIRKQTGATSVTVSVAP